jgi:hypothetical protein
VKNLEMVLREKEDQVETLQKEIEALRFVADLLQDETAAAEASSKVTGISSFVSAPAPTHVMQSPSSGASYEEPGFLSAASGLKQFP